MSVSSTINRIAYSGNGVTTVFSFPYLFLQNEDLVVIEKDNTTLIETTKILTTDYTLSGAGDQAGGSVTFLTAPASGKTIVIIRRPASLQPTDLENNNRLPAETIEESFDRITLIAQKLEDRADRAIRLSDGFTSPFDTGLAVLPANSVLAVNSTGTGFSNNPPTVADVANAGANAASAATDAATAAAAAAAAAASAAAAAADAADLNDLISGGNVNVEVFSGTGAQTAFVLSGNPLTENNTDIFISGVYISKSEYSLSGDTITFAVAPASGTDNIEVVWFDPIGVLTLADGSVTTIKLDDDAVTRDKIDLTDAFLVPTVQVFTTVGAISYTPPTPAPRYIKVKMVGGGGGGGGCGTGSPTDGTSGDPTTFDTLSAGGGSGGTRAVGSGNGGAGGIGGLTAGSTPMITFAGGPGQPGSLQISGTNAPAGGAGGASFFGGGGAASPGGSASSSLTGPKGSGGAGGSSLGSANISSGGGGGAGAYIEHILPAASYTGAVGSAGGGGSAGTSGSAGRVGGNGIIIVEEYYQ